MRGIVRSLLVLSLALGLAAGVICLERSCRPRTGWGFSQVFSEHPDHAVNDEEAEAAFGGVLSAGAAPGAVPGRAAAGPMPATPPERSVASAASDVATRPAVPRVPSVVPGSSGSAPGTSATPGRAPAGADSAGRSVAQSAVRHASADVEQPAANRPMVLGETAGLVGGSSSAGVLRVDVVEEPSRRPASAPLVGLRQADLFDLVRRLRAGDQRAPAARAELLRRGLTEVDLELGRRLFDPDPEVRRQLVRALPALQSVDAAPWLLQLCQDEDPEVRMAALAMTGTTADPRLLDQVEALARQDPDSRIRELAEQLAQQRDIVGARAGGGAARPQPRTPRGSGN
jgi:hypothetical protein